MKLSVCIPTIRPDTLPVAVSSIMRQSHTDWELLVVGQGVDERMKTATAAVAKGDDRIKYLHLEERGISRARNAAMRAASAPVIAFTDDDCEADADWLERLDEIFADPEVGCAMGSLEAPPRRQRGFAVVPSVRALDYVHDPSRGMTKFPSGWDWAGANFAVRISVIDRVGKFDEHLGVGSEFPAAEDVDFGERLEAGKVKVVSSSKLRVKHTHGWRYGFKAVYSHRRGYALGYGALVAKWSLADRNVSPLVRSVMRDPLVDAAFSLKPVRLLHAAVRAWYFRQGFRRCMDKYVYDPISKSLQSR
jgi:glycosyltransferase involved in cell wall biosynthesis